MAEALNTHALETLFTAARTHNGWHDRPVTDEQIKTLYDLVKMAPTSANCSPARFCFVRSAAGKEKLKPTLSSGNLAKTMTAPVTVIVAWDSVFYDRLSCSPMPMRNPGLPAAPHWLKKPHFATAPCRRPC